MLSSTNNNILEIHNLYSGTWIVYFFKKIKKTNMKKYLLTSALSNKTTKHKTGSAKEKTLQINDEVWF